MAISKDKKKDIIANLKDISKKDSIVFLNFKGLPVNQTAEMRSKLRSADVSYYVAKKTLVKKAFEDAVFSGEMPKLEGELAVAYSDDVTAPSREVYVFQKQYKDAISILGGIFEKKYMTKSEIEEIAKIPSMHVLRGMFVNVINSPIQGFVVALQAIADKRTA